MPVWSITIVMGERQGRRRGLAKHIEPAGKLEGVTEEIGHC